MERGKAAAAAEEEKEEEEEEEDEQEQQLLSERLRAAFHYTVACLCEEVAEDKEIQFSKQAVAAISEITFRQCEIFAKDLEMFARIALEAGIKHEDVYIYNTDKKHAKRSTINLEDVKLLARRSNSLLRYITQKSEELTLNNLEQKGKRKRKVGTAKGKRTSDEQVDPLALESEDSNLV